MTYAPNDAEIASRLAAWRDEAEIHRNFEERRYDRFKVMFEGRAEEALAARATEVLKSAFWEIGNKLGAHPDDVVVVMLYTDRQFRDITRAPEWSGGVDHGRIRIPAAGASQTPEAFQRVLIHELTHAIVTSIAPRGVPAWLHEGLAQHFEGKNPDTARRDLNGVTRRIPLASLENSFAKLNTADAQLAYDESLLATETIFERPGFGWTRLLNSLAESNQVERTLFTFGLSYADLEGSFAP